LLNQKKKIKRKEEKEETRIAIRSIPAIEKADVIM
jgi:hypothetical protein